MSKTNTVFLIVSNVFWEILNGAMVGLDKYFIEIMLPQELTLAGKVLALVTMLQSEFHRCYSSLVAQELRKQRIN